MNRLINHQAKWSCQLKLLAVWTMVVFCFGSASALGQNEANTGETQVQPPFQQLETDAIAFVQEHHPELVSLLQSLKAMRQKEYETAIREIVRVRKRLESLAKRDAETHAMELDAWKLQSKIDLLIARGIARDKAFDTAVLRALLKLQVDNQKKRWKQEQSTLKKRQEQLLELVAKIEGHEEERIDQQLSIHLKTIENKTGRGKKPKQDAKAKNSGGEKP